MKNISLVVILIFTISFAYSQDTLSTELFKKDYWGAKANKVKKAKFAIYKIKNENGSITTTHYSLIDSKIETSKTYLGKEPYGIWISTSYKGKQSKTDYNFELEYCEELDDDTYTSKNISNTDEFVNAESVDGQEAMQKLMSQVDYPQLAIDNDIEGKIYSRIVINADGTVNSYCIARGVHPLLDKAAMSQVMKIGNFIPATLNGKKVKSTINIPVVFKLG